MSEVMDKIRDYSNTVEVAKIHVPEFDIDVYVNPLTLDDQRKLLIKTQDADDVSSAVTAIIMLALDENGGSLFTVEDKALLMRMPGAADILARLSGEILNAHRVADPLEPSEKTES